MHHHHACHSPIEGFLHHSITSLIIHDDAASIFPSPNSLPRVLGALPLLVESRGTVLKMLSLGWCYLGIDSALVDDMCKSYKANTTSILIA